MRDKTGYIALAVAAVLFGAAGSLSAQVCRERPMILTPKIEKAVIQRPIFIRPIIQKAIIEQPQFVRPMRERPIIEKPFFPQPEFDWCGEYFLLPEEEMESTAGGRSLRHLLQTGQYSPGEGLMRSYLKAVRPARETAASGVTTTAPEGGSCCGGPDRDVEAQVAAAAMRIKMAAYKDRPPVRFPVASAPRQPQPATAVAAASSATAQAIASSAMIVPRGSR